ncbi:hypothetical protein BDU57DRAFT_259892 [Ampelomyces quisqualis]|uniref:Uncharacterized protein n=1 Tax=Ampelomyces quisqualis TaxID=50730 RepID=A0A6A5QK08_AMPQU|nr:hypothetical protein BDU57DRAFT_259892 [Ampelomyces quisqualis]
MWTRRTAQSLKESGLLCVRWTHRLLVHIRHHFRKRCRPSAPTFPERGKYKAALWPCALRGCEALACAGKRPAAHVTLAFSLTPRTEHPPVFGMAWRTKEITARPCAGACRNGCWARRVGGECV